MTAEEFAAGLNWPAVIRAMVERHDELAGWATLLEGDLEVRSGPPRRAEVERLAGLQANVASLAEYLGQVAEVLESKGG